MTLSSPSNRLRKLTLTTPRNSKLFTSSVRNGSVGSLRKSSRPSARNFARTTTRRNSIIGRLQKAFRNPKTVARMRESFQGDDTDDYFLKSPDAKLQLNEVIF